MDLLQVIMLEEQAVVEVQEELELMEEMLMEQEPEP